MRQSATVFVFNYAQALFSFLARVPLVLLPRGMKCAWLSGIGNFLVLSYLQKIQTQTQTSTENKNKIENRNQNRNRNTKHKYKQKYSVLVSDSKPHFASEENEVT